MNPWTLHLLGLLIGLLLGSIPFGLILTRAAGLGDIRSIGSGNIGATNVLRTGNKKLAAATLLLDALKGTAAVLLASALLGPGAAPAAAVGAVLADPRYRAAARRAGASAGAVADPVRVCHDALAVAR